LHLTLKFLGDVEVAHVGELTAAVKSACASYTPLQLRGTALGVFPDKRFPRVIWIGVREAQGKLAGLQSEIAKAAQPFAKPEPEREFTGHVTLARIKQIDRLEAGILTEAFPRLGQCATREWTADKVVIMRSELLPGGARHTLLEAISLSATI
jgi:2'-5' RNA ligase